MGSVIAQLRAREHFERLIEEKVKSGRFTNASEVVRAGLRLLEDQERLRSLELEELRRRIDEGRSSGPARPATKSSIGSRPNTGDWRRPAGADARRLDAAR